MSNNFKNILNNVSNDNSKFLSLKKIYNKNYNNKNINDCKFEIPANIFQTWDTKNLPPLMFKNILEIKKNNPNFKYYLYDDNDCRNFLKANFPIKVLNAYDSLIPGAYKADLWRNCILYKMGGIYMDIKFRPINGFKLYNLLEKEHWVQDINPDCIYNAVMVCKPNNEILLKAIEQICENVKNKYYGDNMFEPTGPSLLNRYFTKEEKINFDMNHIVYGTNDFDKIVQLNGENVLGCYPGYFKEREYSSKKQHYSILWNNRNIYL